MAKSFKIYTLGCKVNQYDSNDLSRRLLNAGLEMAENDADLAIINTCTVTKSAIAKDKKMVELAKKENPNAKLAVVGCMPVNYREEVEALGVDYIYGTKEAEKLVDEISPKSSSCELNEKMFKTDKSRYFMKVQDGCQQFCSYCIIPYNRGKLYSRPMDEVLTEAKAVAEAGYKEIILCGIHLGLYGIDMVGKNINLVSLLEELIKIEGIERIRLSSIEVIDVSDQLIELMLRSRKICRHLHIPLQAGTDKILKLMNRPYDTAYFSEKINKLKASMPEIAITTDVIVGFPGESDQDFLETVEYIKSINFSKLHVFPFSAHEKTPAATMPQQQSEKTKSERVKVLSLLSESLEKSYKTKFKDKELEVIVDARRKNGMFRGKTEFYFDIEFETDEKAGTGQLIKVKKWKAI